MPDARSMTQLGLNTAMMFAFAIPGGEVAGAAIGVAELVVGLVWQDQPIPPEERPVTVAAFSAALDGLKTEIRQIVDEAKLEEDTSRILALTKTLHANWADVLNVRTTTDALHNFEAYDFTQDDSTAAFVKNIRGYFTDEDTLATAAKILSAVKFDFTADDAIRRQNSAFGLFMLLGSLSVGYLKAAITWEWANEVLGVRRWNAYTIAERAWEKHPDPLHPELEPIEPEDSVQAIPAWQDWIKRNGSRAKELTDRVNDLLLYAEDGVPATGKTPAIKAVYKRLTEDWQARQAKVAARIKQFSLTNGGLSVTDAQTGHTAGPFKTSVQAAAVMEAMIGSQVAYTWTKLTEDGGLDLVNGADLDSFGKTIEQWKKTRDGLKFHTYQWPAAGKPEKVIPGYYSDEVRGNRILNANRDKLKSAATPLTAGMQLTIPSLDGVAPATSYTVKAGDTLSKIGHASYSDQALVAWILDVNKSKLTGQPPAFPEGAVLKYPDLA